MTRAEQRKTELGGDEAFYTCPDCKGTGLSKEKFFCEKCLGEGGWDWVTNITGIKDIFMATKTMENSLERMKAERNIYDYSVVPRPGGLTADVYIRPNKTIKYIELNVKIVK